jgi:hypothetical protein
MTELHFALLLSALSLVFLVAGWLGRRSGDAPRDVRLMLGSGAAFGGLTLLLLSLWNTA